MPGRRPRSEFSHLERSAAVREALRDQRENVLKISRAELAKRSGVAASSIQAIEDGRTLDPGLFTVVSLAVALHIDLSDVMLSLQGPVRVRPLHRSTAEDR